MADISQYTQQIQNAVYGEEVRSSIINALNKVNDDNNSYQQLKADVVAAKDDVDEQVEVFDAKVAAAVQATTDLVNATSVANTAKAQLNTATDTANTAKTNLQNATSTANTAKGNLEAATANANTAKSNADTARTNLNTTIGDAGTAKTNLETAVSNAATAGNTAKQNLETAIANAGSAKSELQAVITNAGTVQVNLAQTITTAQQTISALNTANDLVAGNITNLTTKNNEAIQYIQSLESSAYDARELLMGVTDLKAYFGLLNDDVVGIQIDYTNKTFTRLAGAAGKAPGADFDSFTMFGGRRRCNLSDTGAVNAYFGDEGFAEDGSNGQVMVEQPKFYYMRVPIVLDEITDGQGYHIRKENLYVCSKKRSGFKLHPLFKDASGNEVDKVFLSAYEGSIYDTSAAAYLMDDEQSMDIAEDLFCSIAGAKPASGISQDLTRVKIEQLAKNRGTGWHGDTVKAESANQMLMIIELGTLNTQTAIGSGVVSISDQSAYSCTSRTGSTSTLGNGTGHAASTINSINGTETEFTTDGKVSVTYRGVENPWGNIWKFQFDCNIWGDGTKKGGIPFICTDFNFAESKNSGNYESAGFTLANANGYISAFGYGAENYDWLFMPSECTGNSSLPVGDYSYITANLNGYRIVLLGGRWVSGGYAGGLSWSLNGGVGGRDRNIGGRLLYIPTVTAA